MNCIITYFAWALYFSTEFWGGEKGFDMTEPDIKICNTGLER